MNTNSAKDKYLQGYMANRIYIAHKISMVNLKR